MIYVFDTETFPDCFLLCAVNTVTLEKVSFEISTRRNDLKQLREWVGSIASEGASMVGFNSIGFDYPVLHFALTSGSSVQMIYEKAMAIINCEDRFLHTVKPSDHLVKQIDLFKIHHFDNKARMTSLKALEFNMGMVNIKDLPFPVGTPVLTDAQKDTLIEYCFNDVEATRLFYEESKDKIAFRAQLSDTYSRNFTNYNDVKIGKEIFQINLEAAGITCYDFTPDGRTPKQTQRPHIALADCVPDYITLHRPEFKRILDVVRAKVITETKGSLKDLTATVNGIEYKFGTGGIHASVDSGSYESTDKMMLYDIDVTSLYPSIAIENDYYPEHLGHKFVEVYKSLREQRVSYPKGSAENAMLKLALNGVYGASNDPYSIFFDPLFTMKITITGQMVIAMLIERLLNVHGVDIIQANTDGITMYIPRAAKSAVDEVCRIWEQLTRLSLESVEYKKMSVADVNSYVAQDVNGKVKRKGRYEYNVEWHQDASCKVVAKVAERVVLSDGYLSVMDELVTWPNFMDFLIRTKVNRGSSLVMSRDGVDVPLENTQRYYMAEGGWPMFKTMPPLAKVMVANPYAPRRRFAVQAGATVCPCNYLLDANLPIDFKWYANEVDKLILGVI